MFKTYKGQGYKRSDLTSKGDPIILYGSMYTNYKTFISEIDTFTKLSKNSVLSEPNDIIIPSSGETASEISRASVVKESNVILGGDLNILRKRFDKINSIFIALQLTYGSASTDLARKAEGQSVVHLYNSDIKQSNVYLTKSSEQNKISSFIEFLEKTITLHQKKLEKLEELKKAYLQQLFSKNHEIYPKLKFANFKNNLAKCELGSLFKSISSRKYITTPNNEGKYDVIQQGSNSYIGFSDETPFKNYKDVIIFGDHTLSLMMPKNPFLLATDGLKVIKGLNINKDYLYYVILYNMPNSQGYKRHFSLLKDRVAIITTDCNEQKMIAALMKKIDTLINHTQSKIDQLNTLKKSYLQNMFV